MKLETILKLIIAISVPLIAGLIGSLYTTPAIPTWYAELIKPEFAPPNWVFAPVWTTLYILMGIAAFLVWSKGWRKHRVKVALSYFGIQLVLNTAWSIIFFGFQNTGFAVIEIAVLFVTILLTIGAFYRVSHIAAYLLIPYILWVGFAAYLNYAIYTLN